MITKSVFKQTCAVCAFAVMGAIATPTTGIAKQVTLKSSDGTVNIVGDFVAFEENAYVVKTGLGELRISASRVRCEGDACPQFETTGADVVLAGSDTLGLGLMPLLMSGFASHLDAEAEVTNTANEGELLASFIGDQGFGDDIGSYLVSSSSSTDAFKALQNKTSQIGMAARRIKPAEARELKKAGAGNMIDPKQENIVAVDSLVVITHPSNPLTTLTLDQLRDMYEGRITNWSEVGGADQPITILTRQNGDGGRAIFEDRVFLGEPATPKASAIVAESDNQVASTVNNDPGAIGFVGYAFQRGAQPITVVNHCGMPMSPDSFSAKTEEYALQRRLYLYTRGDTDNELTSDFLNYAMSQDADGVIRKAGFIDLGVARKEQALDSPRARALLNANADAFESGVMREMLSEMVNYDRLSTTFRVRTGSSKLDERGLIDMERLVQFLEAQPEGTKIKLVGFTDNVGAFQSNRGLSIERASKVQNTLQAYAGDRIAKVSISNTGYGEVAPAFCNTDETGRAINRRVEVWIDNSKQG